MNSVPMLPTPEERPLTVTAVYSGLRDQAGATLRVMNGFMNAWKTKPMFVMLARKVCSLAGAKTRAEESEAVRAWVRANIAYRNDPAGEEWVQDPLATLIHRAGDCDDMAVLAGTLLQAIGHSCRALGVHWKGRQWPSHAVCRDDMTGLIIDPCTKVPAIAWPPKGFEVQRFLEGS